MYGPGVGLPVRVTYGGNNDDYHQDAQGNVMQMMTTNGILEEYYQYDAYGTAKIWNGSGTAETYSPILNPKMFQGRERDLYTFTSAFATIRPLWGDSCRLIRFGKKVG